MHDEVQRTIRALLNRAQQVPGSEAMHCAQAVLSLAQALATLDASARENAKQPRVGMQAEALANNVTLT